MFSINDPEIQRLEPCSVIRQLAEFGLLPGREGEVIDLSNAEPGPAPAANGSGPPRLVHWRRSKHPILMAWPSEDGRTLQAWCAPCGRFHTHGRHGHPGTCWRLLRGRECECALHAEPYSMRRIPCTCPPGSGDGHRGAHCASLSRSPMKATGYVVREVRP
jgi:hypothetical protein